MNEVTDLPSAENNAGDLRAECAHLRQQVWILLVLLVVVSGTLTVYLFRQARVTGKDVEALRPQVEQGNQILNQKRAEVENWAKQLTTYGNTHPDFKPLLQKYGLLPAPAPATNPAPAPKK